MTIKIPNKIIITAIVLLLAFYAYGAMKFNAKVKLFNSEINIGDDELMVRALLGKPSHYWGSSYFELENEAEAGEKKPVKQAVLYVYRGTFYFCDDIVLVFDYESRKLVEKNKVMFFRD